MMSRYLNKFVVLRQIETDIKNCSPKVIDHKSMFLHKSYVLSLNYNIDLVGITFIRKHLQDRKIIKCVPKKGCWVTNRHFIQTNIDLDFIIKSKRILGKK